MSLRFTKMHGLGNDYVYIDCFEQRLDDVDRPALARAMSDRHRGIGSDGLILIAPSEADVSADVRMEMYNADGSRGEMCGNGIRCVAKYAIEHGRVARSSATTQGVRVQTDRGVLVLTTTIRDGVVGDVRVDMGPPILSPDAIPVALPGEQCVRARLDVGGEPLRMTCVSMGNPHAVVFVDALDAVDMARLGPKVERHALFPNRTNFHVVCVQPRSEAAMRTWERGSGLTMACGTGACAVLVAGVLEDRLDRTALIHLPGGDLRIEWPQDGSVFMTGPATEVFTGVWPT
ncbi:MAG: diaminopimelate epimerase [Phycisphaerae bacterium]